MKLKYIAAAVLGLAVSGAYAATDASALKNDMDKLSYSIGADLGTSFKKQDIQVNPEFVLKGLQDALEGKTALNDEQMKDVLTQFQKKFLEKRTAEYNKRAEENKIKGEKFLAENKKNPGVVTLTSGLQYKIVSEGKGKKPTAADAVTVDYTGKLLNGDVFDSSEAGGKPVTFKLNQVIPGWTEVLQLMPEGSTWEVWIPANLAYGPRNIGDKIGPNETLSFKIHLITVEKEKS